jgi:homoserine O-acetyltransferase
MNKLKSSTPLVLEIGESLSQIDFAYHTYGKINEIGDNVIWVCHALTANSDAADWWSGLIGEGKVLDTKKYFIICANNLGSCYGATNARSIHPKTQEAYGKDFPLITIRDMALAHEKLRRELNINAIQLLIGGSMGGQIALEWTIERPNIIKNLCVLATNAQHSAWGIAFNEAQRMAIESDSTLYDDDKNAGSKGLEAARAIAMLSYRNSSKYNQTQIEDSTDVLEGFKASRYQRYQGKKLRERFDVFSYLSLSKSMDSHNVGRKRGGIEKALSKIIAPTLVIGIATDILFPPEEQELIAKYIPNSDLEIIESSYGHDGFLIEYERIGSLLTNFLGGDLRKDKERQYSTLPGTELF